MKRTCGITSENNSREVIKKNGDRSLEVSLRARVVHWKRLNTIQWSNIMWENASDIYMRQSPRRIVALSLGDGECRLIYTQKRILAVCVYLRRIHHRALTILQYWLSMYIVYVRAFSCRDSFSEILRSEYFSPGDVVEIIHSSQYLRIIKMIKIFAKPFTILFIIILNVVYLNVK